MKYIILSVFTAFIIAGCANNTTDTTETDSTYNVVPGNGESAPGTLMLLDTGFNGTIGDTSANMNSTEGNTDVRDSSL